MNGTVSTDQGEQSSIAARILDVLSKNALDPPQDGITLETTLEDVAQDSFDIIEVVFALEEEFDVSVKDNEIREAKRVSDLVEHFEKLIETRNATTP